MVGFSGRTRHSGILMGGCAAAAVGRDPLLSMPRPTSEGLVRQTESTCTCQTSHDTGQQPQRRVSWDAVALPQPLRTRPTSVEIVKAHTLAKAVGQLVAEHLIEELVDSLLLLFGGRPRSMFNRIFRVRQVQAL